MPRSVRAAPLSPYAPSTPSSREGLLNEQAQRIGQQLIQTDEVQEALDQAQQAFDQAQWQQEQMVLTANMAAMYGAAEEPEHDPSDDPPEDAPYDASDDALAALRAEADLGAELGEVLPLTGLGAFGLGTFEASQGEGRRISRVGRPETQASVSRGHDQYGTELRPGVTNATQSMQSLYGGGSMVPGQMVEDAVAGLLHGQPETATPRTQQRLDVANIRAATLLLEYFLQLPDGEDLTPRDLTPRRQATAELREATHELMRHFERNGTERHAVASVLAASLVGAPASVGTGHLLLAPQPLTPAFTPPFTPPFTPRGTPNGAQQVVWVGQPVAPLALVAEVSGRLPAALMAMPNMVDSARGPGSSRLGSTRSYAACRFCLAEEEPANLLMPCKCTAPVHRLCLLQWRRQQWVNGGAPQRECEVCRSPWTTPFTTEQRACWVRSVQSNTNFRRLAQDALPLDLRANLLGAMSVGSLILQRCARSTPHSSRLTPTSCIHT